MYSKVNANDLTNLSDFDMMRMIFSSGDFFPGFYRYTLGTQVVGEESLGLSTLIFLYLEQNTLGHKHSKEDWFELQHEIYDRDIASETARNFNNEPHVRAIINKGMMQWYFNDSEYDIIYLDNESKVESFEQNKTYFFMGSLIRYEDNTLKISYDDMINTALYSLNVTYEEVTQYLDEIFAQKHFNELLLNAQIIAKLKFANQDDNCDGELVMNDEQIDSLLLMNPNMKVFGAPGRSRNLPIRFAKHIRFTNFRRHDDGRFHVWKTNQNW